MSANVGMNCLASGSVPPRLGNAHPNIVPYQVFEAAHGQHLILACGNDKQFAAIDRVMGQEWHTEPRFATNPQRVAHRDELVPLMQAVFSHKTRDEWIALFEAAQVPCGPINNIAEALAMPQVQQRGMVVDFADSPVNVLGNPIKLSATPVQYHSAPAALGAHSAEILRGLGYSEEQIVQWRADGVV